MRSKKLYHNAINDITLSLISTGLMSDMVTVNIITHLFLHHPTSNPLHRSANSLGMKRAFLHLVFLLLELLHFNTFFLSDFLLFVISSLQIGLFSSTIL